MHGVGMSRMPLPVDDEGTYMAQAWAVQVRHTLTPYTYWYDHPPVGWIQLAGWTFVTHAFSGSTLAVVAGRRIMLLYALVDAALLYLIARRLRLSRLWASVAVLAFALSPLAVDYQRMVYLDNLAMPWLLAAFALALDAAPSPVDLRRERRLLRGGGAEQGDDAAVPAGARVPGLAAGAPHHPRLLRDGRCRPCSRCWSPSTRCLRC